MVNKVIKSENSQHEEILIFDVYQGAIINNLTSKAKNRSIMFIIKVVTIIVLGLTILQTMDYFLPYPDHAFYH